MFFNEDELSKLIDEDMPYFDLTTRLLDIGSKNGVIEFRARDNIVLSSTEEAAAIMKKLGLSVEFLLPTSTCVERGEIFLKAHGSAESLHAAWKISQNILEYASGIATKMKKLIDTAKGINPDIEIVTTRKQFPGGKKLSIKAVLAGGGYPHRLGLSETILVFPNHIAFCGSLNDFLERLPKIKKKSPEKKFTVEAKTVEDAKNMVLSGVDIVQLDKFSAEDVEYVVSFAKNKSLAVKISAAGGINENNIENYAKTGVDFIVLSCVYFAKPADIEVKIFADEKL
jgi:molybdenum transport protein